ncbi:FAD-dependent oxidoreductase [Stieleria varia]|nr:FAD-dependent oxidoreductase [Stieleria varia]
MSHRFLIALVVLSLICIGGLQSNHQTSAQAQSQAEQSTDLVIYGGTSAGIAAAVQAKRMGMSVVVIEPSDRVGGLTTGGLGQTDIGNKSAIGGIAREFYQDIAKHYAQPEAWKWQTQEQYRSDGQSRTQQGEDAMWTFEPSAALSVYQRWIDENKIDVVYGQRLDRDAGVMMTRSRPARIIGIRMESGETYRGKMFIDATYEGDLLATAGVSYTVGREANSQYGETLNGVQTRMARHHQLFKGIDPYVVPGNADSGLLPHIDPEGPGIEGGADHRVQAYCFRMCLTDHPENRIEFHQPEGYRPEWYELMLRNYEAGENSAPWINSPMPNRKTDTNNRTGFSTDFIGQNYDYPEASYERREQIVAEHRLYQQGLMWTLANHPRVPLSVRKSVSRWGMCKDEFTDGNGWQNQLYIREARRMVGEYVMTQKNCQGVAVPDPVGLAAYTMDSHNQQRYVDADGHVRNEGDVQVGGFPPYGISYRSILPQAEEVSNLLVPVCLSATHIAFGSIRMEPVFMVLGQSAATAAKLAIDENKRLHDVQYDKLAETLKENGQILEHVGPKPVAGIDPSKLPGVVVDNDGATLKGPWMTSSSSSPRVGHDYMHDGDDHKGECVATYVAKLPAPGDYRVVLFWPPYSNRATNAAVTVIDADGRRTTVHVNQRNLASKGQHVVGTYSFSQSATVEITNADSDGHVIADAVQFIAADDVDEVSDTAEPKSGTPR